MTSTARTARTRIAGRAAPRRREHGFSIVESLVSVVLFSFAVIGTAGLQGTLVGVSQNSEYRAEASFYAEQLVSLALVDVANATCYTMASCSNIDAYNAALDWRDTVTDSLPGATDHPPTATYTAGTGDFSVTVYWQRPGDDTLRNVTFVTVVR